MIAHVAEAGEQRGRVVLHVTGREPHRIAVEAALRIAEAFQSEVESLYVEDMQLLDAARFPFASEISFDGRRRRPISLEAIERDMQFVAASVARRIQALARGSEVPIRLTVVRGETLPAIAHACALHGPWNLVALAEPIAPGTCASVRAILRSVADTTGVVIVGQAAKRTSGPVVVTVEDIGALEPMLRTAERLLGVTGDVGIVVLLVAADADQAHVMDAQARLVLGPETMARVHMAIMPSGAPAELAERLRRLNPGFVIGHPGGLLVPDDDDLAHLVCGLECPLLLIR